MVLKETLKVKWYWVARFICQVFALLFFRYRVYGRRNIPRAGPFIIAGNHQSFLDPVFHGIGSTRRLLFMARDTLFRSRLFGGLIRSTNAIPVSRDKADIGAIKLVLAELKNGHGVCLYPEGTRTADGKIAALKPGFSLLCRRSKAPVVPTLVDGAFECWPRQRKLFTPGPIVVCFGKPLPPERIRQMSNEELADWLTRTLREMQRVCRLRQGKEPYDYRN
ncbi:MAG: 1-acyl-sn-glycerol-3-phosphate acyltransferase [Phycisphaerales bacterium]|nr:MAG: 1-acyl-sn-glycerol-3-phosphate acyltransferase [Phycisphaerales bacterium]